MPFCVNLFYLPCQCDWLSTDMVLNIIKKQTVDTNIQLNSINWLKDGHLLSLRTIFTPEAKYISLDCQTLRAALSNVLNGKGSH